VILADTSVWVDHLRKGDAALATLLSGGQVVVHPFVIGELACGYLERRDEILSLLTALPPAKPVEHHEALAFVARQGLQGKGLGWIAVHLLASARITGCSLWTRDKALSAAAEAAGVGRGT
jgi:hypothetical protein